MKLSDAQKLRERLLKPSNYAQDLAAPEIEALKALAPQITELAREAEKWSWEKQFAVIKLINVGMATPDQAESSTLVRERFAAKRAAVTNQRRRLIQLHVLPRLLEIIAKIRPAMENDVATLDEFEATFYQPFGIAGPRHLAAGARATIEGLSGVEAALRANEHTHSVPNFDAGRCLLPTDVWEALRLRHREPEPEPAPADVSA